jgi:hypothetical protein
MTGAILKLAKSNKATYPVNVAMTFINLAILYGLMDRPQERMRPLWKLAVNRIL